MQNKNIKKHYVCVMPMAGEGLRFKKYGYKTLKPLITINKIPMFIKATKSFPKTFKWIFIAREKINFKENIKKFTKSIKKKKFVLLNKKTQGQASTVYKSLKYLNKNDVIIVHSCDLSFKINLSLFKRKIQENDLLVFTAKGSNYHFKNHKDFSWVKKTKDIYKISLKKKFKSNKSSKVLIGTFAFKSKKIMKDLLEYTFKKKIKINNEYYMDTLIFIAQKMGYRLNELLVNKYHSWGSHPELLNYKN